MTEETLAEQFHDEALRLLEAVGSPDRLLAEQTKDLDGSWRRVVEAGWLRTLVPESEDGLGLGLAELGAVFRAVGRRPIRGPLLDQAVTVPLVLRHCGAAAPSALMESLDGGAVVVWTEDLAPPYGDGPDAVSLREGVLHGCASLVPFADVADHLLVVADADGARVLLHVPASEADVRPVASSDPSTSFADVALDGVRVEPTSVLAVGEDAAMLRERIRGALRLMAGAELSGATEELTNLAVAYAKVREQFGRPIGGFQAIRHILADMAARTSALRSLVDSSLSDSHDEARWSELGRTVKAYSTEPSRFVAEQSLQIHGGMGFTWETRPHLHLRRVLTLEGYLGETNDLLNDLGQEELR